MVIKEVFVFAGVFILSVDIISNQPEYYAHKYRIIYAIYVKEADNQTQIPPAHVHICQLGDQEKSQLCRETMEYPIPIQHKIKPVDGPTVGEVKTYEVSLGGWDHLKKPPVYVTACLCPTDPPLYLRDNSSDGVFVDVYFGFRQDYGEVPDCSPPWCRIPPA